MSKKLLLSNRWKIRLAAVAACLSVVAAGVFAAATPAQASASQCPSNSICMWTNSSFSGAPTYYWTNPGVQTCIPLSGSINDKMESFYIKAGQVATVYQHAGCSGGVVTIATSSSRMKACYPLSLGPWWPGNCAPDVASAIWFTP